MSERPSRARRRTTRPATPPATAEVVTIEPAADQTTPDQHTPDLLAPTTAAIQKGRILVAHHRPHPTADPPFCAYCGRDWPCPIRLAYIAGRADAGRPDAAVTRPADQPP
jgi:hypothetical protein